MNCREAMLKNISGLNMKIHVDRRTTKFLPAENLDKKWIIIDAEGLVLGRMAAFVATRLRGKHRPDYTPHIDCGDHVVIINAEKVLMTGNKMSQKKYRRHTGYPGGLKEVIAGDVINGRFPERVIQKAVKRMLPKESPLARRQFSHLHVYAQDSHPHTAQKPTAIAFASANAKNTAYATSDNGQ